MRTRDSIAGPEKGLDIPEEIDIFTVSQRDHPESRDEDGQHSVIQWDGGEYCRQNTWIMADEDTIIDLDENR